MSIDRDGLRARLRSLFLDELDEHVVVLNRGLVGLEQGAIGARSTELVNELFRSAHSLKGAAQAAAIEPVAAICHGLESALADLRDHGAEGEAVALQPLFQAVDALAAAGRRLRAGSDVAQLPAAGIIRTPIAGGVVGDDDGVAPTAPPPIAARPPAPGPRDVPGDVEVPAPQEPVQAPARVPAARLEALLGSAGEVLLACEAVHAAVAGTRSPEAASASLALASAQHALTDAVRGAGMVPFGEACAGLDRVARDVGRAAGRQVRLAVEGGDVELDRPILESLREPLLHLVRNAVDHGIEKPEARAAAGKDAVGTLVVAAALRGDRVAVTVSDDGAGVDADAVRAAADGARATGATIDSEADVLRDLVFVPGLSTAPFVTEVSGRGVGLDAVRAAVEGLGGSVALKSTPGAGTRVTMLVPVTRSVIRVLLVAAGGETFALPTSGVVRIIRAPAEDLRPAEGRTLLAMNDHLLPVAWLVDALGSGGGPGHSTSIHAVVVDAADGQAVLVVDGLVAEQEAVIKPPPARLAGLPGVLGATILASGRVVLVMNPATTVRLALERARPAAPPATEAPVRARRVLLVDDTLTTRTLERSILETAGYQVVAAVDGLHALELLQSQDELQVDAVVSDVNMPRMDGLGLCQAVRASNRFNKLPVVLVTSLASEEDRRRGVEAGADAYIAKSEFDQSILLDTLARLL